jgi:hypothetical protein
MQPSTFEKKYKQAGARKTRAYSTAGLHLILALGYVYGQARAQKIFRSQGSKSKLLGERYPKNKKKYQERDSPAR